MAKEINDTALFKQLTPSELESIKPFLHEKSYAKGAMVFAEGTGCERIYIVREGRIKIYRTSASGREQILEILEEGSTCACNPGQKEWFCGASGQALSQTSVWFLTRGDYLNLLQNYPKVSQALNKVFAKRLQCLNALIEDISLKDAKVRLVKFLLDFKHDVSILPGQEETIYLNCTREEIAHRLGTARETVARHLSTLQKNHFIKLEPHRIIIKDREGLQTLIS